MKKIFSLLAFVCLLGSFSQASFQNENGLIGKAIAAYHSQCGTYNGPIEGSASVVSACFVDGFITEVTLSRKLNCQQVDCDAVRLAPIARVTFGCDNEVSFVECLN